MRLVACCMRSRRLRRHHDQRALLGDPGLAAQQVEVLRRRRRVGDPDVALGGELEEALQARGGVLGARALVAVGQQQRQARGLAPLGEAGDDELVDDHLGAVDEVAELRLPEHERLGRLLAVAVLEAQRRDLRQRASCAAPSAPWRPARFWIGEYSWPVLCVVQDEVALAEGAALGVLAGEADRRALDEQRREGERLGVRPVDAALGADGLAPALELAQQLGMDREALGHREQLLVELAQQLDGHGGGDLGAGRAVELVGAGRPARASRRRRRSPP